MIKETLHVSDYEIRRVDRSKIDPSKTITKIIGIACPHCKRRMDTIHHGCAKTCETCGLGMKVSGNALYCELEKTSFLNKVKGYLTA